MENPTIFVRFLRTHPAFGHFVGQVGEVLKHVGEQLIADGFAEPATAPAAAPDFAALVASGKLFVVPGEETATVPADAGPQVPALAAGTPDPTTDEIR